VAESHTQEAILIVIFGLLQKDNCIRWVNFFFIVFGDEIKEGLHFAHGKITNLDVELGCSGVKKCITFCLVSIELSDLLFIYFGEEGNPFTDNAVLEFFNVRLLLIPKLVNHHVSV
jgi:hypothetical protein